MEDKFKDILDKDEKIISIIKPVKKRYWKEWLFPLICPLLWPHAIIIMVFSLFTFPYFLGRDFNNRYYAYTNKRLIVRSGVFGVNFKCLEYKDITSTSVKVGFLDKGCSTGSLEFSNPSIHADSPLEFSFIPNPYENMRLIKEQIDLVTKK